MLTALRAWKEFRKKEDKRDVLKAAGVAFCQQDTSGLSVDQLLIDFGGTGALDLSIKNKALAMIGNIVDKWKKKRLKKKSNFEMARSGNATP